jgi:hypothetical protein
MPLPRPSTYTEEDVKQELAARVRFVSRYGTFERMTGDGFVPPDRAWRLGGPLMRLEMERTIHMTKGTVTFTIYVTPTPFGHEVARVVGFHGDSIIWVQHPDLK